MTAVIQPAVAFVTDLLKTSAKLSHVGDVPGLLTKVPYPVLLTGHCLAVSGLSKDLSSGRLLSFVVVRWMSYLVSENSLDWLLLLENTEDAMKILC